MRNILTQQKKVVKRHTGSYGLSKRVLFRVEVNRHFDEIQLHGHTKQVVYSFVAEYFKSKFVIIICLFIVWLT